MVIIGLIYKLSVSQYLVLLSLIHKISPKIPFFLNAPIKPTNAPYFITHFYVLEILLKGLSVYFDMKNIA